MTEAAFEEIDNQRKEDLKKSDKGKFANLIEDLSNDFTLTKNHDQLKRLARLILLAKGYNSEQIFQEYELKFPGCKKSIIADVCAITKDHSSVVECGTTPSDRTAQLKLFFDEIILLPYPISDYSSLVVKPFTEEIREMQGKLDFMKERVNQYAAEIQDVLRLS